MEHKPNQGPALVLEYFHTLDRQISSSDNVIYNNPFIYIPLLQKTTSNMNRIFKYIFIEGSLEVKLPTIWRDEKAVSREKNQKRKDQKKEDAGARKGRKVAKHSVFSWFCGSGGLKSRLAKAAGAETSGEMRDEKLHAVVARSTFPSQHVQNTSALDHLWKLRCRKSAPRCGAKHISKSKCTKHHMLAPLLEVQISKKCTPLWREAHFEVKMYKALGVRTTFGGSDVASLRFGSLHYTIHSTTLQYITLHSTTLQLQLQNYTTTLHYTPQH